MPGGKAEGRRENFLRSVPLFSKRQQGVLAVKNALRGGGSRACSMKQGHSLFSRCRVRIFAKEIINKLENTQLDTNKTLKRECRTNASHVGQKLAGPDNDLAHGL